MKKILLFISIIVFSITLSSCTLLDSYHFDYEAPELSTYKLSDMSFDSYTRSSITDYSDIEDTLNEEIVTANIYIQSVSFDDDNFITRNFEAQIYAGSGVIFYSTDDYYYALTNMHVVNKHRDYEKNVLSVTNHLNNIYDAFIYEGSMNEDLDLAIIVFPKIDEELTVLDLVDAEPNQHTVVVVISNPLSERDVITNGEILGYTKTNITNRYDEEHHYDFDAIMHSAAIDSGSSGSMLISYDFDIIGINYASNHDEEEPLHYAIPANLIVDYILDMIE